MNNSSVIIGLNGTVDLWEALLVQIGSTWTLDSLYLFLNTTLGLFGVVLNAFSLFVLFRINENQAFYKYLKLLTINGMFVCLLLLVYSFSRAPRYLGNTFGLIPGLIQCYLANSISFMVQFGNFMNIFILFERISYFKTRLQRVFKQKVNLLATVAFVTSVLLCLPAFFINEMRDRSEFEEALRSQEKIKTIRYCKRSSFSRTVYGNIIVLLTSFIKDFLFLLFEIALTAVSVYYLKEFFKQKKVVVTILDSGIKNSAIKSDINKTSESLSASHGSSNGKVISTDRKKNKSSLAMSRKANKIISIMSLCLAVLSLISNLTSFFIAIVVVFYESGIIFFNMVFTYTFLVILKYFANFFILCLFNRKFRRFII
jgi:hypothetical protein